MEPRRALVRAVKGDDPMALRVAARLLAAALAQRRKVGVQGGRAVLISVPGHRANPVHRPLEDVCATLTRLDPGLQHAAGVLHRREELPRSATSLVRPSIDEHLRSLDLRRRVACRCVILVDDVFTLGRTTAACRMLLRDAGASEVLIASLARTSLA